MNPSFHSELEQEFHQFLLKKGYPADAIAFEARLGDRYRPDFAITDLSRDRRIAFFEVKGAVDDSVQRKVFAQLIAYSKAARAVGAPCYLVVRAKGPAFDKPFDFYYVDSGNSVQPLSPELFPSYHSLSANSVATTKEQIATDIEQTKDRFQTVCWVIAGIFFILAIVDFFCDQAAIELVDSTRLTLLGIVVALVVIPFAQKFKILGIEYERYLKEIKKKE